jgi:hypothetical protein
VQERQDLLVDAFDVIIHSEDAEGADEADNTWQSDQRCRAVSAATSKRYRGRPPGTFRDQYPSGPWLAQRLPSRRDPEASTKLGAATGAVGTRGRGEV